MISFHKLVKNKIIVLLAIFIVLPAFFLPNIAQTAEGACLFLDKCYNFGEKAGPADCVSCQIVSQLNCESTLSGKIFSSKEACENRDITSGESPGAPEETKKIGELELPSAAALNQLGTTSVPTLIGRFIKILMGVVGSIMLAVTVYGGFLWMFSMGNQERQRKAQGLLLWAGLGLGVILASYAIVSFVFDIF